MARDGVRMAILLGVGGAAVGGPEALRLLLAVAAGRRSATVADVAVVVFLIGAFTALVLGTVLLARFFRDARRNAGEHAPVPGTERLAKVTAAVALAAMLFVTASLLAVPSVPAQGGNAACGAAGSCPA